jgi:hypothetical protein
LFRPTPLTLRRKNKDHFVLLEGPASECVGKRTATEKDSPGRSCQRVRREPTREREKLAQQVRRLSHLFHPNLTAVSAAPNCSYRSPTILTVCRKLQAYTVAPGECEAPASSAEVRQQSGKTVRHRGGWRTGFWRLA